MLPFILKLVEVEFLSLANNGSTLNIYYLIYFSVMLRDKYYYPHFTDKEVQLQIRRFKEDKPLPKVKTLINGRSR